MKLCYVKSCYEGKWLRTGYRENALQFPFSETHRLPVFCLLMYEIWRSWEKINTYLKWAACCCAWVNLTHKCTRGMKANVLGLLLPLHLSVCLGQRAALWAYVQPLLTCFGWWRAANCCGFWWVRYLTDVFRECCPTTGSEAQGFQKQHRKLNPDAHSYSRALISINAKWPKPTVFLKPRFPLNCKWMLEIWGFSSTADCNTECKHITWNFLFLFCLPALLFPMKERLAQKVCMSHERSIHIATFICYLHI